MLLPLEPLMDVALDPVVDVPVEPITGALGATGALLGAVLPVWFFNAAGRAPRNKHHRPVFVSDGIGPLTRLRRGRLTA